MSRAGIRDGLVAVLRATSGFTAGDGGTALANDHRALNAGVDRAAIVLNDRFEQRPLTIGGGNQVDWRFSVEVYIRHNNDIPQARADSDIYVQNIVDKVNGDRTLGGAAFDALVEAGVVADENFVIGGKPFLLEALTVRCTENLV